MKNTVIWDHIRNYGTEMIELRVEEDEIHAHSTAIMLLNDIPMALHYEVELNSNWVFKRLQLKISNQKKPIELIRNQDGRWFDEDGDELKDLYGAIDIDISSTPFTNTLPIKRSTWLLNEPQHFEMVFISIPDLTIKKVKQTYTLIKDESDIQQFQYKSRTFESDIFVDKNGLVINYPKLFTRKTK